MFDVVLRTGFFKPGNRALREELLAAGAQNMVEAPLSSPAPDNLLEDLLATSATHVLFIDDAVSVSASAVKKLARQAQLRGEAEVLCINTPVSRKMMGLMHNAQSDAVRASSVGALYLVPWCAMVAKCALARVDFTKAEGSITGLLLAVENTSDVILAIGSEPIEINFESWIVDVFHYEHERLATAIENLVPVFESLHQQFRLTCRGTHATVDKMQQIVAPTRFSVICPVFKAAFLEDAVRSVLSQTYEDLEFLILVDGPPEQEELAIRRVLDQFAFDPRLRATFQQNQGTGLARATLADMATGEYIVSIDDDDMFVPKTLECFARAIDQSTNGAPAALRGGIEIFGFADLYLAPRPRLLVDGIPCDHFEANQPWCLHTGTLHANGGLVGDPNLRHCGEDADYFLRLDSKPNLEVLLIDEPLYLRRLSGHNQTLSFTSEEFHVHLRNICTNYIPAHFRYVSMHLEDNRPFIRQATRYVDMQTRREVIAATRFFDYALSSKAAEAIIDLELTALCNADCTFCPRENLGRTNKYLPMETVENIARQIRRDGIPRKVVLCGIGEPTLHPQVEKIVEILTRAGAEVCMTNNGTRMDTGRFTRLADAGLQEVNFSVNATTEETRQLVMKQKNFDRVRRNIRDVLALRDAKYPHIDVHLSFVLCPQNHREVDEFVREWRDCSANGLWIHPVNNRGNLLTAEYGEYDAMDISRRYAKDPRVIVDLWDHGFPSDSPNVCAIAQVAQFITADGEVLLCALDHERKNIIGNVAQQSLLHMQTNKLELYRHGHFNAFCEGCTYCPRTHKSVAVLG